MHILISMKSVNPIERFVEFKIKRVIYFELSKGPNYVYGL